LEQSGISFIFGVELIQNKMKSDFSNYYSATVDDKGRVVLPAPYKRDIGHESEGLITVEIDPYEKCLNVYPAVSWEKRIEFIKSRLNPNDPRQSKLLDKFYQNFVRINMADNGRLNIPNPMLERIGISKEVIFSGQGDRIRLWDAEAYRKAMLPDEEYPDLYQEFLGGGFNSYSNNR
jgi:MraZ protein